MYSKIAWAVIAGVLALHLGTFFFYAHEQSIAGARTYAKSIAERALTLQRVTDNNPDLLKHLNTPFLTVERAATLPSRNVEAYWPHAEDIRQPVLDHLSALGFSRVDDVQMWILMDRKRPTLTIVLPTDDDQWFSVEAVIDTRTWRSGASAVVWMTILSLVIIGGVLWGTRRITRRLPQFIEAAEQLGAHQAIEPLPETGPAEIRRLGAAFNHMQQRIKRQIDERGAMLAAVSHDLRTFITRVKLRTDYIGDDVQRDKAVSDLDAITRILDEVLAFVRDEQSSEPRASVDLASMLASLVDDERDLGNDAVFEGPQHLRCFGQPTGLHRAFANLIKNAVRYGGAVAVHVILQGQKALIEIRDPGAGIPPEQHATVLDPYVRLDPSRNRNSGGTGLGLAIVANVIRRHAGTLKFLNREPGFVVRVMLPTSASGAASMVAPPENR